VGFALAAQPAAVSSKDRSQKRGLLESRSCITGRPPTAGELPLSLDALGPPPDEPSAGASPSDTAPGSSQYTIPSIRAAPPRSWLQRVGDWISDVWHTDYVDERGMATRPNDDLFTGVVRRAIHQNVKPIGGGVIDTGKGLVVDTPVLVYDHSVGIFVQGLERTIEADKRRLAALRASVELVANWHQVPDHEKGRIVQRVAAGAATGAGTSFLVGRGIATLRGSAANRQIVARIGDLRPGQILPDGLEIVVRGSSTKPGTFLLRPVDRQPLGAVVTPGKSATIAADLTLETEIAQMFGRSPVRGDVLSGGFVEDIRAAGFEVIYAPTKANPLHVRIVPKSQQFDDAGREALAISLDVLDRKRK
jgi:hypothetical protein